MESFWNLFFIDRDRWGVFFRLTDNGVPVIEGEYGKKGGRDVAGYHAFELNYLAHTYNRTFLYKQRREDNVFCQHFKPHANSGQRSINVLPDFSAPGDLEVVGVVVNGVRRTNVDPNQFQIQLEAFRDGDRRDRGVLSHQGTEREEQEGRRDSNLRRTILRRRVSPAGSNDKATRRGRSATPGPPVAGVGLPAPATTPSGPRIASHESPQLSYT